MAGDVEGQGDCYSDHPGDTFQVVVYVIAGVSVGASFIESGITDDRKQVVALIFGVLIEYHLHFLCPFDYELLTGLAAAVGDIAVFEV